MRRLVGRGLFKYGVSVVVMGLQVSLAFAQSAETSDPGKDEARTRFKQGVALARSGNCEGATAEFEASYALYQRPNTLYNIAQCQETLFRYDRAVEYYEKFLAIAAPDDPDRPAVEATMRSLQNLLARVEVQSNLQGDVWIGDRKIGVAPGTVLLPAGRHVLEVRRDGYLPARREIQAAGRQTLSVSVELKQSISGTPAQSDEAPRHKLTTTVTHEEDSGGLSPAFFWGALGATLISAGVGTFFGLQALSLKSDADNIDPRLSRTNEKSDIDNTALMADVFFVGAAAFAASSVVLFILTDWEGGSKRKERMMSAEAASVTPWFSAQSAGLSLKGAL
ncbi:MAG: PEGA domain-containing protein [Myxococcales bacterium]|nr:MAG: PEGA domain-containing protein [Myxococcales bacterium]